jgi:hypothetical protein
MNPKHIETTKELPNPRVGGEIGGETFQQETEVYHG